MGFSITINYSLSLIVRMAMSYKCHFFNGVVMELCVLVKSHGGGITLHRHTGFCFNVNSVTIWHCL